MNDRPFGPIARRRVTLSVLLLAWLPCAPAQAQAIADIRVITPRDFGYTIGDTIRHELRLTLAASHGLDERSLPEPGRLNRWLDIAKVELQEDARGEHLHYRILVDYQIMNAPRELSRVTIPQLEFRALGEPNAIPVFLPEWTFAVGPIVAPAEAARFVLRPDRDPLPAPVTGRIVRVGAITAILLALGGYWLYRQFLLPRLRRRRFPFTAALHELRGISPATARARDYRRALQAFHAAVNATAGHAIFGSNLDDFLAAHSEYVDLKNELVAIYARSQAVFFDDLDVADPDASLLQLVNLCRVCSRIERSAA